MKGSASKDVEMAEPPEEVDKKAVAESEAHTGLISFAVAGYATCSSLMLVVNKVTVYHMPSPSFVLFAQVATSAIAVWVAGVLGLCPVDALELGKVKSFFPVALAFLGAIFTNIKTLQYANVETFIVFRASTPIIVSIADYMFLGRELPSMRSWMSLMGLVVGAAGYVMTDDAYHVSGYFWVCIWYCVFCFDQIYIKHAVDSVKMQSNWGRVFYTNFLAALLLLVKGIIEPNDFPNLYEFNYASGAALAISCALGVGMSYFAFLCRKVVSASSFTVLGNCCKIVTVLINLTIWEQHAGPTGITCLVFCLGCAYFYKQAPKRSDVKRRESSPARGGE